MKLPVYTYPVIDACIDEIEQLYNCANVDSNDDFPINYKRNALDYLEDIREANKLLRDAATDFRDDIEVER
jgi:hypothetical protein